MVDKLLLLKDIHSVIWSINLNFVNKLKKKKKKKKKYIV